MPKIRTHKGASKRFKLTGTGKIKKNKIGKNHLLACKSQDLKRDMKHGGLVSKSDTRRVMRMLPNINA